MPHTIIANTGGKSRFVLGIPPALTLNPDTLVVTDVSTGSTSHYGFDNFDTHIVQQPGAGYQVLIGMLTTRPGGQPAPSTAGHVRVQFQYQNLSNQTFAFDSGSLAANFVTDEVSANHDWVGPAQLISSNVGGQQTLIVPVTGICCVKSGVVEGPAGEIWNLSLSGQTPDALWTTITYQFPPQPPKPVLTGGGTPMLTVTLTAENDVVFPFTRFRGNVFAVPDNGG